MGFVRSIHLNAQSLSNKVTDLERLLFSESPDFVVISETLLNDHIFSSEFEYPQLVHKSSPQECAISVEDVTLVGVYLSPNALEADRTLLNHFISNISTRTVICGDINHPYISWKHEFGTSPTENEFLESVLNAFLVQMIDFPTHEKGTYACLLNSACMLETQMLKLNNLSMFYPVAILAPSVLFS